MILLGYGFIQKIGSRDFFFKVIIYFALFSAVNHVYLVVNWAIDNPININRLRLYAGKGDVIELFGFIFIFCRKKLQINFRRKSYVKIAFVLLTISFLLYFSRTQAVAAIVIISSIYGYTKLNKKAIIVISSFVVLAGGFFWYLNKMEIPRSAEGLEGFLYKIKNAPKEMFSTDINVNNRAELWDKWRSYEAKLAIEQVLNDRSSTLVFGKGIGALVDLKDDFMLNGKLERKIPTIHNGYAFVFFKSGILGLSLYFFVVIILYLKAYSLKSANAISIATNNLLSGFGLYLMFTTLVVAGLYNTNSTVPLILGFILGVEHLNNLSVNEDSDNRN
ncbi:O-antigen ligase family protein [[Muricauda] lutisoli]|uniref:O-antigen ligase domain-containing protein n=1 Tax=[Muricauda] lutisoli TaxID=2816035 RepID=A0ABS3EXF7_9FLAO|nr:O-antigen ligase family protein [[Muricauda] lutisoli]MBO0330935.1 hypothetical protein [[Muricauda] lutisoli]